MANILLLDDNEVARKAMRGILSRGSHRLAVASTVDEAWNFLRENIVIDLVIMEMRLHSEKGSALLERIRLHWFLKHLPVVIYTKVTDRNLVRHVLQLKVQNYLIKPFDDEKIFAEIAKARAAEWRSSFFDDEKSFCVQMNLEAKELRGRLSGLREAAAELIPKLERATTMANAEEIVELMEPMKASCEGCGYWGMFDLLESLSGHAQASEWGWVKVETDALRFSDSLIFYHLNPAILPPGYLSEDDRQEEQERIVRERWVGKNALANGPLADSRTVAAAMDKLEGVPVIESIAATFQMAADGQDTSLPHLADLIVKDPGLAAQTLRAASKLPDHEKREVIDDPKMALQMLGSSRLKIMAGSILPIEERLLDFPPMSWQKYWMFQVGTARMCGFMCEFMEMPNLMPTAYWAGLMHELGKLVLLRLYPHALQGIVAHSLREKVPLEVAEKRYIDCTHQEIGAYFAQRSGLPRVYANVIRWCAKPQVATEDMETVGLVAMAHYICVRHEIGFCGEVAHDAGLPLEKSPHWQFMRETVFPGFNVQKFDSQIQRWARELKAELTGRFQNK
jgi:HD-like signal output (HDOD) protein/CheY-like chemotaxis protein